MLIREWKRIEIDGIMVFYRIYSDGTVYNETTKRYLQLKTNTYGYKVAHIRITDLGINRYLAVHRLVAKAFVPNPDNKPQVNHIDGNKENNAFTNLEWVTASENSQHAHDTNLHGIKCIHRKYAKLYKKVDIKILRGTKSSKIRKFLMNKYGLTWKQAKDLNDNRRKAINKLKARATRVILHTED